MPENTIEFRARYAETDQMGVVYHTNYLVWCEMGRTELMRQLGATYAEMERQGVFLAVSRAQIRFRNAARYDDPIRVRTRLTRVRSRGVTFHYVVERAEGRAVLAEAETDLVCVGPGGSPRKLPALLEALLGRALGQQIA
ncbi:MAG: acyl-CoA thioesterase [Gemmatimonadota bacterium]|nr:MAG: acyl-CoA thioesterase [Gemmatimonadota bacterium]